LGVGQEKGPEVELDLQVRNSPKGKTRQKGHEGWEFGWKRDTPPLVLPATNNGHAFEADLKTIDRKKRERVEGESSERAKILVPEHLHQKGGNFGRPSALRHKKDQESSNEKSKEAQKRGHKRKRRQTTMQKNFLRGRLKVDRKAQKTCKRTNIGGNL